jgi:hypothetical protein
MTYSFAAHLLTHVTLPASCCLQKAHVVWSSERHSHDPLSVHDDILYVVSAKTPFKLPKVVNGSYTLPTGGSYIWRIETHGTPASVDAMAGPKGFLDSLSNSYNCDEPSGPRTGDGTYTLSKPTKLQLAP